MIKEHAVSGAPPRTRRGASSSARPRASSRSPRSRCVGSSRTAVSSRRRHLRDSYDIIAHGGRIVEWLVEDGDPVSPGQPILRLHPQKADPMAGPITTPTGAALADPRHRRLPAPSHRPQLRDRRGHRLLGRVDPGAVRHQERRRAGDGESVIDMSQRPPGRPRDGRARAPTSTPGHRDGDPAYQTPAPRPSRGPHGHEQRGSLRHLRGLRRLLPRHLAGQRHGPRRQRPYVLVVGVERLSDFTSPTDRGTAFIFGDGAGAASCRPRDPGHRTDDLGLRGREVGRHRQNDSWVEVRDGDLGWPTIGMKGQTVFRWAVWGMAPVAQKALDAAGVTSTSSTPSSRTRPTCASSTR